MKEDNKRESHFKNNNIVYTYALAHFIVDFSCALLMFRSVNTANHWQEYILMYNFCAFALQMPFGLLADRWNRNAVCAAAGCGLVVLSYGLGTMSMAVAMIAGIGNGLFHVGGGIDVLNRSSESPRLLGIFVSPGAFGIYLGTLLGKEGGFHGLWSVLSLLAVAVLILAVWHNMEGSFRSGNVPVSFEKLALPAAWIALICLFVVVCLRSYLGMVMKFPWKSIGNWGLILAFAVVFGKMAGGFLAEKTGVMKASILSLGAAVIFFLFSNNPIAGTAAVFFFNMTMPVTLWAVAKILHGCKGFSFGLLTFGLFLGFLPMYLGMEPLFSQSLGLAAAAFGSLVLLCLGIRKAAV